MELEMKSKDFKEKGRIEMKDETKEGFKIFSCCLRNSKKKKKLNKKKQGPDGFKFT